MIWRLYILDFVRIFFKFHAKRRKTDIKVWNSRKIFYYLNIFTRVYVFILFATLVIFVIKHVKNSAHFIPILIVCQCFFHLRGASLIKSVKETHVRFSPGALFYFPQWIYSVVDDANAKLIKIGSDETN